MSVSIGITIIIILAMVVTLIFEIYDSLKIFIIVTTVFLLLGFITIDEAVAGFSNKGVISIGVLFIIAGSLEKSYYFRKITEFNGLDNGNFNPIKLFVMVTSISAFLNNTPVVSLFIPVVKRISNKTNISISKLLIPISYLAMLGGTLTLIGTSTNLVVSGFMQDMGIGGIGFFELTKVSLPVAFFGIIYISFFYKTRLPDNSKLLENSRKQTNEHFIRFIVGKNSSIIGRNVKNANLRDLRGVYLVEIERCGVRIFPITPEEIIKSGDVLIFAGQTDQIDEIKNIDNLVLETDADINTNYFNHDNTEIVEVVVTQYIGKPNLSIKKLKFREKYNAVVIGIIRNGDRIPGKIGSIEPKLGDILLLIADKSTIHLIENENSFAVVNREEREVLDNNKRGMYPLFAFLVTLFISLFFEINILYASLIGLSFLLITNSIQIREALDMVQYKTLIIVSISFALGKVLMNTGTANFIAKEIEPFINGMHPIIIMIIIFIITNLFTTIITNNAAAILALPIVYEIAKMTPYDIRAFMVITAIAASSSFISPYGYQTNTMVYGVGGYCFKDFIKFGYPLTIVIILVSSVAVYLLYF